jgi:hypothetical protein
MATMTIRTTVAFDPATAARLERLAKRWGVSKSETLRRALESAENGQPLPPVSKLPTEQEIAAMTPREAFAWLRSHPQPRVPGGWGDNPSEELREMREQDALLEEERERERNPARQA